MANREIEAVLRVSTKAGSMAALNTLSGKMKTVQTQATAYNRSTAMMARGLKSAWLSTAAVIGPVAIAAAGVKAIRTYADVERRIERIGITADATEAQTGAALGKLQGIAKDLHMPFDDVVEGMDGMVASGKSMDEALSFMPSVGKAAQASGADFREMATTADAVNHSFGILAPQMEGAFDILAKGGKLGKFELKDMASQLPSLAPAFAALGYKGEEGLKKLVAMLQGVRMETGTSGEAADALMDTLTKIRSTSVAANFKRFGVDLGKSLDKATAGGEDLIDAFRRISVEAVHGDLSKLPQLFTDKQMLVGMRALINNADRVKEWQGALSSAAGTVDQDFKRVSKNVAASLEDLGNSWEAMWANLGKAAVDAGAVGLMDAVSKDLEKAAAIRKTLDAEGKSWLEQKVWWAKNVGRFGYGDSPEADEAARKGGYHSPAEEEALKQYRRYWDSLTPNDLGFLPGQVPYHAATSGKAGLPNEAPIPVRRGHAYLDDTGLTFGQPRVAEGPRFEAEIPTPTARPSDTERAIDAADAASGYDVRHVRYDAPAFGHRPDPQQLTDKQKLDASALDAWDKLGEARRNNEGTGADGGGHGGSADPGDAIRQGGAAAGQSIEEAARAINQAGQDGGSAFARMLEGMGTRIGEDAARSFKANIGDLNVNVNAHVSGGGNGSGGGGRDVGRSGGDVRRGGGPR